jgi:hypothetical protein
MSMIRSENGLPLLPIMHGGSSPRCAFKCRKMQGYSGFCKATFYNVIGRLAILTET